MKIFYQPNITSSLCLDEIESHHAIKVLRLKNDDEIIVLDGKGNEIFAKITEANSKKCLVQIINISNKLSRKCFLELVVAPTKNIDRIEWLVEKSVEVGIDSIKFIHSQNSERNKIKIERLQKIAISAMKQSKNNFLPILHEILSFEVVINEKFKGQRLIAHCEEGEKKHIKDALNNSQKSIQLFIGPEGDFSQNEIQLAISKGALPVALGESRLRTETAAFYGCVSINSFFD